MSYLDVYFSRVNHGGETTSERIRDGGIRSFERWLAESPHTIEDLSVERGLYFSGILITNKDKEAKKLLFLHVANDIPLQVGDIMNWRQDDGSLEKWLLLSEEKKVNGKYRTFEIIKCNYLVKWIDLNGHLQQSWAYVLSSTDSKIKGNFRTWHNLISPQPNKYAELIMPRVNIERGTNFIIEDENWQLVEYDHTSVAGVIYLSVTENKVNMIYDDLNEDIADTDRLAQYRIDLPPVDQTFSVGNIIHPVYTLMKNGIPIDEEQYPILWSSSNKRVVNVVDNELIAVGNGTSTITLTLKDFPKIKQTMEIIVSDQSQVFSAYIEGKDTIKLDRYNVYRLNGFGDIPQRDVHFSLEMLYSQEEIDNHIILEVDDYAVVYYDKEEDNWFVHANKKNKLHALILKANYNGNEYTKEISVVPLW